MRMRHRFKQAADATGPDGFAQAMARHTALFYPRADRLVVTFDNMSSRNMPAPAFPWAYEFLEKLGVSHLGIAMSRRNDWFRHGDLVAFFARLESSGFFQRFSDVVFYGSSMGGYGALSFSVYAPGARVVAFSPQTTLDQRIAPFETRYRKGYARGDWSLPYSDGAQAAATAREVMVFADPYVALDRLHVARLWPGNVTWFKCPSFGHVPARGLKHGGVLPEVVTGALLGQLTKPVFHRAMRRARNRAPGVTRNVIAAALETGHAELALRIMPHLETRHPECGFTRLRQKLISSLAQQEALVA